MPECSIPNCQATAKTRGFCLKHYQQWLRSCSPDELLLPRWTVNDPRGAQLVTLFGAHHTYPCIARQLRCSPQNVQQGLQAIAQRDGLESVSEEPILSLAQLARRAHMSPGRINKLIDQGRLSPQSNRSQPATVRPTSRPIRSLVLSS